MASFLQLQKVRTKGAFSVTNSRNVGISTRSISSMSEKEGCDGTAPCCIASTSLFFSRSCLALALPS